jgi:hypothetical protein
MRKCIIRTEWNFYAALIIALMVASPPLSADNLATCMDGRYPNLCDRRELTSGQLKKVAAAELRENLKICLDGRYPALCRHGDLTEAEALRVGKAEHAANLSVCLDGRYPTLCRHGDLTTDESTRAQRAEHIANLSLCLDGRYPILCRHGDLTAEESNRVSKAEASHPKATASSSESRAVQNRSLRVSSSCDDGHWIDSVIDDGSIIKLEDGSIWQVDDTDTVDSALWLPVTDVIVCDDKIINSDDNESVHATRIR